MVVVEGGRHVMQDVSHVLRHNTKRKRARHRERRKRKMAGMHVQCSALCCKQMS